MDLEGICNVPNPPLVDIILFGLSFLGFPSRFRYSISQCTKPLPLDRPWSCLIFVGARSIITFFKSMSLFIWENKRSRWLTMETYKLQHQYQYNCSIFTEHLI